MDSKVDTPWDEDVEVDDPAEGVCQTIWPIIFVNTIRGFWD